MKRFTEASSLNKYPRELENFEQEKLFRKFHYLVNVIANRVALRLPKKFAKGKNLEDLREAGEIGFAEALQNFFVLNADRYADENVEENFKKYAGVVIYGRIRDHQREMDPLSRTARKYSDAVVKAKGMLIEKHSSPAGPTWTEFSDEEIAEILNITPKEYNRWKETIKNSRQQRNTPIVVELDDSNLARKIAGTHLSPEKLAMKKEMLVLLSQAINEGGLTREEKKLIQMKYFENQVDKGISQALHCSLVEMRNLEEQTLVKLNGYFRKRGLSLKNLIEI